MKYEKKIIFGRNFNVPYAQFWYSDQEDEIQFMYSSDRPPVAAKNPPKAALFSNTESRPPRGPLNYSESVKPL